MKNKLILASVLLSVASFALAGDKTSYVGHDGRVVYSNVIQPEITTKYFREGNNQVVETTTKSCVSTHESNNRLTCRQWRTDKNKSSNRVNRH